jgi:hypothetical protein
MSTYKIFISHYVQEKPIAVSIKDLLNTAYSGHAKVFISDEIPKGADWLKIVSKELSDSDEILTIFTHKSADRPWLNIETGFGIMAEKPVTPILCNGFKVDDLPLVYQLRQGIILENKSDVQRLYNDIFSRIRKKIAEAQFKWDDFDEFWEKWMEKVIKSASLVPIAPYRPNINPVVWMIGSHTDLDECHQQKALDICQAMARAFMANRIQIIMGTSRMLDYLGDEYTRCQDNTALLASFLAKSKGDAFRHKFASEHAESLKPAPNPIVLLGSLRKKVARELFNDAIGRIPDIAILIGGRDPDKSGKAFEEYNKAKEAEIPCLPISFTGGTAEKAEPTLDKSLNEKVERLQTLDRNIDAFQELLIDIVFEQVEIQLKKK